MIGKQEVEWDGIYFCSNPTSNAIHSALLLECIAFFRYICKVEVSKFMLIKNFEEARLGDDSVWEDGAMQKGKVLWTKFPES